MTSSGARRRGRKPVSEYEIPRPQTDALDHVRAWPGLLLVRQPDDQRHHCAVWKAYSRAPGTDTLVSVDAYAAIELIESLGLSRIEAVVRQGVHDRLAQLLDTNAGAFRFREAL